MARQHARQQPRRRAGIAEIENVGGLAAAADPNPADPPYAVLLHDLSTERLSGMHWPEYGGLILNLRNVVTSMDRVAEASPISLDRYARRPRVVRG